MQGLSLLYKVQDVYKKDGIMSGGGGIPCTVARIMNACSISCRFVADGEH